MKSFRLTLKITHFPLKNIYKKNGDAHLTCIIVVSTYSMHLQFTWMIWNGVLMKKPWASFLVIGQVMPSFAQTLRRVFGHRWYNVVLLPPSDGRIQSAPGVVPEARS